LLVDVIQRRVYWQNEEGRGAERGGARRRQIGGRTRGGVGQSEAA
jgi:hypothetical protein